MKVEFFGNTNEGRVRTNNEDSFIAKIVWNGDSILCAAIDGIGGYEGGEVAAEIARDTITKYVEESQGRRPIDVIKQALVEANNAIVRRREADSRLASMGCVVTTALIDLVNCRVNLAHVGDSRLYSFHNGVLTKLSHDHSIVGYREEIGDLTEEEAMRHPMRNVIQRCVGEEIHMFDDPNFIDAAIFPLEEGCTQLLFCSDGLSDMLHSSQIAAVLASGADIKDKVESLIAMANDAGGKDNVTVVIAEIDKPHEDITVESDNKTEPAQLELNDNDEQTDVKGSPRRRRYLPILIGVLLAIIIGVATLLYFNRMEDTPKASQISTDTTIIIPVENISDTTHFAVLPEIADSTTLQDSLARELADIEAQLQVEKTRQDSLISLRDRLQQQLSPTVNDN